MRYVFLLAALLFAAPAHAQTDLEKGLLGALRGCEEWVLNPASWSGGTGPFTAAVGLGNRMGPVRGVEEVNLPPPGLRKGNRYWRINATPGAGYVLVVSDQLPMCHITGGGDVDLQPTVEAVLNSPGFAARWARMEEASEDGMASTRFRNRQEPAFWIQVSRANRPGERLDRVQLIATATYDPAK